MESDFFKPIMPKEHGLWVWVFLPIFVGGLFAEGSLTDFFLVLGVVFFCFLAMTPTRMFYKNRKRDLETASNVVFWSLAYMIASFVFAVPLVVRQPLLAAWLLLVVFGFYFGMRAFHVGYHREAWFEYGGLAALSLGSLAAAHAVTGGTTLLNVGVWLLVLLFLLDRTMQSRRVVRLGGFQLALAEQKPTIAGRLRPVFLMNLLTSFLAMLFALAILDRFHVKFALFWPFAPGFFVTLFFYSRPPPTLKRLGYAELFLALAFGASFVLISRFY